jgi:hypothetical protein
MVQTRLNRNLPQSRLRLTSQFDNSKLINPYFTAKGSMVLQMVSKKSPASKANPSPYWVLAGSDQKKECWVINHYAPPDGRIEMRKEFGASKCPKCGRIDRAKELKNGIPPEVIVPKGMPDFFHSDDGVTIVSSKAKRAIESAAKGMADFIPIPSSPSYWVLLPKKFLSPPKGLHIYPATSWERNPTESFHAMKSGPCTKCGRYMYLSWREEHFDVPAGVVLVGNSAFISSQSISTIVNNEVYLALKKAKLKGLSFRKLTPCPKSLPELVNWWGTASVGREYAIKALIGYLKKDEVAVLALNYLAKEKAVEAKRAIQKLLKHKNESIRQEAEKTIKAIGK